jgi:uncharacterized protein YdiU (UPF0061 family)
VLNTDNMSILGLTIDYGPYGWIDAYDPDWTPNTTDAQGRRYRFGWQAKIAYWNLTRLAAALSPLFADAAPLQEGLQRYREVHAAAERDNIARKLGLAQCRDDDIALMEELHGLLQAGEMDMTIFFRNLADADAAEPGLALLEDAFYDAGKRDAVGTSLIGWLKRYAQRTATDPLGIEARKARMHAANPRYVLRNYLVQQAIDQAEAGDESGIAELLEVMRRPYDDQPGNERFAQRRPDWARDRAGCSMLSCSS